MLKLTTAESVTKLRETATATLKANPGERCRCCGVARGCCPREQLAVNNLDLLSDYPPPTRAAADVSSRAGESQTGAYPRRLAPVPPADSLLPSSDQEVIPPPHRPVNRHNAKGT